MKTTEPVIVTCPENQLWIELGQGGVARIGLTPQAQEALGDIIFIECPPAGSFVAQNDVIGALESVKAAVDLCAPASGQVLEVNPDAQQNPSLVNTAPLKQGWLFSLRLSKPQELDALNRLVF